MALILNEKNEEKMSEKVAIVFINYYLYAKNNGMTTELAVSDSASYCIAAFKFIKELARVSDPIALIRNEIDKMFNNGKLEQDQKDWITEYVKTIGAGLSDLDIDKMTLLTQQLLQMETRPVYQSLFVSFTFIIKSTLSRAILTEDDKKYLQDLIYFLKENVLMFSGSMVFFLRQSLEEILASHTNAIFPLWVYSVIDPEYCIGRVKSRSFHSAVEKTIVINPGVVTKYSEKMKIDYEEFVFKSIIVKDKELREKFYIFTVRI